MPDWGGRYARHDPAAMRLWIELFKRSEGAPVTQASDACGCWKQAAPLCAACQLKAKNKRESE